MPCYTSSVIVDGIRLDLDPEDYKILGGVRRGSVHKQVVSGTVFQDRGFDATDIILTLKGKLTSSATLDALFASYRKTGHQFNFTDFKGNDVTCIFEPGKESLSAAPLPGSSIGWTYTMSLCVVAVNTWIGASFPATS